MTLPLAILAGGKATRLGELARDIPKCLQDVAGRPFLHWQLDWVASQGHRRVVLLIGHLGDQVRASVGDGARFGLDIAYSEDGDRPLGTAGALRQALPLLGPRFLVTYGDSLLDVSLGEVEDAWAASRKAALMTVLANGNRWDTSNLIYRDGAIRAYDKVRRSPEMQHIDYGLGGLSEQLLQELPDGPADLATVYQTALQRGELAAFEVAHRFYEIGTPAGLQELRTHLTSRNPAPRP